MKFLETWRPFALLVTIAAVAAAFAFLLGSGPTAPHGAQAAGGIPSKSTSCIDVYQDLNNNNAIGSAHDGGDQAAASSMNRIEPSQTSIGDWDVTTVTYLGPDLLAGDEGNVGAIPGDAIPDVLATASTCAATTGTANSSAEAGAMHPRNSLANQYSARPSSVARFGTYDGTNAEDGGAANTCSDTIDNGDSGTDLVAAGFPKVTLDAQDPDCYDFPGTGANTLVSTDCSFSEASTSWSRTDTFTLLSTKTKKAINYGKSILTLNTSAPSGGTTDSNGDTVGDQATNPQTCIGGLAFPSVIEATNRTAQTDDPLTGKNTGLTNDADGGTARDTSDGKADDWDGDGCTDWDELGKNFSGGYPVSVTGTVRGLDPFNPNDCDQNYDSTMYLSVVVAHNTAGTFATSGNGIYYKCILDSTDPKTGATRNLAWRMGCYQDSTLSVVNTNYAQAHSSNLCTPAGAAEANMCGDGQSGGTPPGATTPGAGDIIQSKPYLAIDAANYPTTLSGALDKGANTLGFNVCVATGSAPPTGPYIGATGAFDTRVMAGTFNITTGITNQADCQNGPPYADGINVCAGPGTCQATLVELGSKKDAAGAALPVAAQRHSDRDGCSDTQELRASQTLGGMRDPFNDWDYMNPTLDLVDRVDDIIAVVNKYHADDTDSTPGFPPFTAGYNQNVDRTAVPGSASWSLGPPNGIIRVDDILAEVKQYHHDCNA